MGQAAAAIARDARGQLARSELARKYALVGLANRAGFVSDQELNGVVENEDIALLDQLVGRAGAAYDGSLELHLAVYAEHHFECAVRGRLAGLNDDLDLDPLMYFRLDDSDLKYVTAESLWISIIEPVLKGHVIAVKRTVVREQD